MKHIIFTLFIVLITITEINGQTSNGSASEIETFKGEWTIDLRPSPDAQGYYQKFKVTSVNEKSFTGSFYNSKIRNAQLNTQWRRLYFAFTTSDGTNDYYHSGYFADGKVYGISYCPGRKLTAPWTGTQTF